MKKLMVAVFAVAIAAAAQAASVSWMASSYNYVTKDGAVQTSATALAGDFVLVYLGNDPSSINWASATVANVGTVTYAAVKGTTTAKVSGSYAWTYGAEGTPSNGDIYGVMFRDDKGNLSQLQYTNGDPVSTTFTITGMGNNTYSGNFTFATGNYTAVPEPTSGLMLVLGIAGLALKRKRA